MTAHSAKASGRVPRVDAEREKKRERILDAAEQVFAKYGFFAARVAQIATAAGVADGTIYLYFRSKDDILISLFESRMERVIAALETAVAGLEPEAQLRAFVREYLRLVNAEPTAAEVLTIELRQSSKFMKEYDNPRFAEFLRLLAGIITRGQTAGVFSTVVPAPQAARLMFGMLDELTTAWLLTRESGRPGRGAPPTSKKFDIMRAAEWVDAFVHSGLATRPKA